jgi:arginase
MDIAISNVHLDLGSGRRGTDMGPSAMLVAGLYGRIRELGHTVTGVTSYQARSHESVHHGDDRARFLHEITDICAQLADGVERSMDEGSFPLALGGDHAQAIGTISGISRHFRKKGERIGVIWVDAHTDMNTPDTSSTGNIHGMPLAALCGVGPDELTRIAGDEPALRGEDVCIIGVRDVDAREIPIVRDKGVRVYTMSELDSRGAALCFREAFARVTENTAGVHLSFDLDGIDPTHAPGVGTPVPGGLTLRESHLICELASRSGVLVGMEVVELNPTLDLENKTGNLAVWLVLSALGKRIMGPSGQSALPPAFRH